MRKKVLTLFMVACLGVSMLAVPVFAADDQQQTEDNQGDESGSGEEGSDVEGSDEEGSDEEGTDEEGTDEEGTDEEGSDEEGSDEADSSEITYYYEGNTAYTVVNNEYSIYKDSSIWYSGWTEDYEDVYGYAPVVAVTAETADGESLEVGEYEDYYVITPSETGLLTITCTYELADNEDATGSLSFTLNVVSSVSDQFYDEDFYIDTDFDDYYIFPGTSKTVSATLYVYDNSKDDYVKYDGNVTYQWIVNYYDDDYNVISSYSMDGNPITITAPQNAGEYYTYDWVVYAYDRDGELLAYDYDGDLIVVGQYYSIEPDTDEVIVLKEGESTTFTLSLICYNAEYPDGIEVPFDVDYSWSYTDYYLTKDGKEVYPDDYDISDITYTIDSDGNLTIKAGSIGDYAKAFAGLYLELVPNVSNTYDEYAIAPVSYNESYDNYAYAWYDVEIIPGDSGSVIETSADTTSTSNVKTGDNSFAGAYLAVIAACAAACGVVVFRKRRV